MSEDYQDTIIYVELVPRDVDLIHTPGSNLELWLEKDKLTIHVARQCDEFLRTVPYRAGEKTDKPEEKRDPEKEPIITEWTDPESAILTGKADMQMTLGYEGKYVLGLKADAIRKLGMRRAILTTPTAELYFHPRSDEEVRDVLLHAIERFYIRQDDPKTGPLEIRKVVGEQQTDEGLEFLAKILPKGTVVNARSNRSSLDYEIVHIIE